MDRQIRGFHRDEDGDWIAELACGHTQHVRHRPPFEVREWVLDDAGRAERATRPLDCPLCDRTELPEGLDLARTSPTWDEESIPPALLVTHRVARGTWGLIDVERGSLRFVLEGDPPRQVLVDPRLAQPIPPEVGHHVELLGPVRFSIKFFRIDG